MLIPREKDGLDKENHENNKQEGGNNFNFLIFTSNLCGFETCDRQGYF